MTRQSLSFRPRFESLEDRCLSSFSSGIGYAVVLLWQSKTSWV
jgi:hypothetical protein